MSSALPGSATVTPAEYLAREEAADQKSEYEYGAIIPMPGGTLQHSQIKVNAVTLLSTQLADLDFVVLNSDVRVRTPDQGRYYYPDVSVVAGAPTIEPQWKTANLTNPCLIIEVISPSTGQRDRGTKFEGYKTIPSLREYLLIDSNQMHVTQWVRGDDEQWTSRDYRSHDDVVALAAAPAQLALAGVYRRVAFS
jgi:Uma2 family endonuclease